MLFAVSYRVEVAGDVQCFRGVYSTESLAAMLIDLGTQPDVLLCSLRARPLSARAHKATDGVPKPQPPQLVGRQRRKVEKEEV